MSRRQHPSSRGNVQHEYQNKDDWDQAPNENGLSDLHSQLPPADLDDSLLALKKLYGNQLLALTDLFSPDWTEADLLTTLEEVKGDLDTAINRIMEGTASKWGEVSKKAKKDKLPKGQKQSSYTSESPPAAVKDNRSYKSGNHDESLRGCKRVTCFFVVLKDILQLAAGAVVEAVEAVVEETLEVLILLCHLRLKFSLAFPRATGPRSAGAHETAAAAESTETSKHVKWGETSYQPDASSTPAVGASNGTGNDDGSGKTTIGVSSKAVAGDNADSVPPDPAETPVAPPPSHAKPPLKTQQLQTSKAASTPKRTGQSWAQLVKGPDPPVVVEKPKPGPTSNKTVFKPTPPSKEITDALEAVSLSAKRGPSPKRAPSPSKQEIVATAASPKHMSAPISQQRSPSPSKFPETIDRPVRSRSQSPTRSEINPPAASAGIVGPPGLSQQQKPRQAPVTRKLNQEAPVIMPSSVAPTASGLRFGQFSGNEESGPSAVALAAPVEEKNAPAQSIVQQPSQTIHVQQQQNQTQHQQQQVAGIAGVHGLQQQRIPHPVQLPQQQLPSQFGMSQLGSLPMDYGVYGTDQRIMVQQQGYYNDQAYGHPIPMGQKYGAEFVQSGQTPPAPAQGIQSQSSAQQTAVLQQQQQQQQQQPQQQQPQQQQQAGGYPIPYGYFNPYYINQYQNMGYPNQTYGQPYVNKGMYQPYAAQGSVASASGNNGGGANGSGNTAVSGAAGKQSPANLGVISGSNPVAAAGYSGYSGVPHMYQPSGYDEMTATVGAVGVGGIAPAGLGGMLSNEYGKSSFGFQQQYQAFGVHQQIHPQQSHQGQPQVSQQVQQVSQQSVQQPQQAPQQSGQSQQVTQQQQQPGSQPAAVNAQNVAKQVPSNLQGRQTRGYGGPGTVNSSAAGAGSYYNPPQPLGGLNNQGVYQSYNGYQQQQQYPYGRQTNGQYWNGQS
ncbi:RNAPII degradation factor [Entophlyctis sp. JEL0112]|nr:RNAPII degradation factor [Entophlyctis sp. JEL0112]